MTLEIRPHTNFEASQGFRKENIQQQELELLAERITELFVKEIMDHMKIALPLDLLCSLTYMLCFDVTKSQNAKKILGYFPLDQMTPFKNLLNNFANNEITDPSSYSCPCHSTDICFNDLMWDVALLVRKKTTREFMNMQLDDIRPTIGTKDNKVLYVIIQKK